MSDQQITCSECGDVFVFSNAEQQFYATKGLAAPPKRCKACRQARRSSREGGGGGESFGRPQRRFSNDVNEYRSPMTGGYDAGPRYPQGGWGNGGNSSNARGPRGGGAGGGGGEWNRDGRRDARPQGRGPYGGDGGARGNANGPRSFGDRPHGDNGGGFRGRDDRRSPAFATGEYRSPSFPRERAEWGTPGGGRGPRPNGRSDARGPGGDSRGGGGSRGDGRSARPDGGRHGARHDGGHHDGRRAPRADHTQGDSPRAARPERPRYDITCATCGAQSQVPFKPLEGRQVFCQPCYRARKGTGAGAEVGSSETALSEMPLHAMDGSDAEDAEQRGVSSDLDAGIVE